MDNIYNTPMSTFELEDLPIATLKKLCKNHNLKVSGTRQELINRLLNQQPHESTTNSYTKLRIPELKSICKERQLKVTGKKGDLIQRLMEYDEANGTSCPEHVERVLKKEKDSNGTESKPKKSKEKKMVKNKSIPSILKLIEEQKEHIHIRRNAFGNYEHADTGFVFDVITKKVRGKQCHNGVELPLDINDIELCKTYGFDYIVPSRLVGGS